MTGAAEKLKQQQQEKQEQQEQEQGGEEQQQEKQAQQEQQKQHQQRHQQQYGTRGLAASLLCRSTRLSAERPSPKLTGSSYTGAFPLARLSFC